MKPSLLIIYTGGTIGMKRSKQGYTPAPGFIKQQMMEMPEFHHAEMPHYTILEYQPLIDSSNVKPEIWLQIAKDIAKRYRSYDGFIILHGTDTMAYTASALSFLLENLQKPVILTGSQVPLIEIRNDARDNLISAMLIASRYPIPEVCLYFSNKLFRGNRVRKMNTYHFSAFDSPNYPPLAQVGTTIVVNSKLSLKSDHKPLAIQEISIPVIGTLRLFPGMSHTILKNSLQPPLQALMLETYGVGNAPDNDPIFLSLLKEATKRGVIIVNCTQCLHGSVNMSDYATGSALQDAGVISAYDMTPESVITKLIYLFSKKLPITQIKKLFQKNLRGELTT